MPETKRRLKRCPVCGTHTGTHWYDYCPPNEYEEVPVEPVGTVTGRMSMALPNHRQPIVERTPGEKAAYIQGFEACLKQMKKGLDPYERTNLEDNAIAKKQLVDNLRVAESALALTKETL